jgi:hypothetical protein
MKYKGEKQFRLWLVNSSCCFYSSSVNKICCITHHVVNRFSFLFFHMEESTKRRLEYYGRPVWLTGCVKLFSSVLKPLVNKYHPWTSLCTPCVLTLMCDSLVIQCVSIWLTVQKVYISGYFTTLFFQFATQNGGMVIMNSLNAVCFHEYWQCCETNNAFWSSCCSRLHMPDWWISYDWILQFCLQVGGYIYWMKCIYNIRTTLPSSFAWLYLIHVFYDSGLWRWLEMSLMIMPVKNSTWALCTQEHPFSTDSLHVKQRNKGMFVWVLLEKWEKSYLVLAENRLRCGLYTIIGLVCWRLYRCGLWRLLVGLMVACGEFVVSKVV